MRARKDPHLDGDLPHIPETAAVRPHAFLDDPLPDAVLDLLVEQLAEDVDVLGESLAELDDRPLPQLIDSRLASGLVGVESSLV